MYAIPYKTKQFFFTLIKLSIVLGAFYFIYEKLTNNGSLSFYKFINLLNENTVFSVKNIGFLVFLSIFNWFFEILKWQTLVSFVKKIAFKNALEQSLGALTASLFTPNRIGEYGAKAMYYTSNYRKHIMLINLVNNVLQMSITVIFGVIGIILFTSIFSLDINYYRLSIILLIILISIILVTFGIKSSMLTVKGISLKKITRFILNYPKRKIVFAFLFSLIRYAIFSFQFYFLLHIFNIEISYINAMVIISSMYLLASIIPSIFIFDVAIKGSVAVYLFSFVHIDEVIILSITTIMWILNFVLPGIIGSYYVLRFKLPKNPN